MKMVDWASLLLIVYSCKDKEDKDMIKKRLSTQLHELARLFPFIFNENK